MRWPLAGVAAWFALGIALGGQEAFEVPIAMLFVVCLLAGVLAWRGERRADSALAVCLLTAGMTHLAWTVRPVAPNDLRHLIREPEVLAIVRGELESTPEVRIRLRNGKPSTNCLAVLVCETIRLGDAGSRVTGRGRVLVFTPGLPPAGFRAGVVAEVAGVLRRPRGAQSPGGFDHAAFLHWQGIDFELRVSGGHDWRWVPGASVSPPGWIDRFQVWARRTLALGLPMEDEATQLLWAMTLGWRTALTPEIDEVFMRSGTLHVFAISGLHIALIAGIATQMLRLFGVPRGPAGVLVIGLCWVYTLATGAQPSAIRSTLMTSFVVGGALLARPSNVLNSLAAAGIAVLVWDPRQLFQVGFQLSFAVVAVLGLLAGPLRERLVGWVQWDAMLADRAVPGWRRWLLWAWRPLAANVAVSIAAWLGSLPLGARHFHLVSGASLLANLAVVPLSSMALAGNMASLVCGGWAPGLAELFNHASWFFMHGMLAVSRWAAAIPYGCRHVEAPSVSLVALYYLLLASPALGLWRMHRSRYACLGCALALGVVAATQWWRGRDALRVVVLPLGGGHVVFVRDGRGDVLVDTGDRAGAESMVVPFLRSQGVNALRAVALTHGDVRHVGGAGFLAERFPTREFWLGPTTFRSPTYRVALADVASERCRWPKPRVLATGIHRGEWSRWHPEATDRFSRADDACQVLLIDTASTRVLLVGDLDRAGQATLRERHPDLHAEVLVLAPPASGNPPDSEWLRQLGARWILVADASFPVTARASLEFRERLAGVFATTVYLSDFGSADLRWDGSRWRVLDAAGREFGEGP